MFAQDFSSHQASESSVQASPAPALAPEWLDSVDISLLTCGPGQEVWSYYGHTALRIEDKAHGKDLAVNWGMFSFNQDYFIARFVFGLTDYQIGIFPMSQFIEEYTHEGRWVLQQRMVLTRQEKMDILLAIEENNKEENRTYRYNFFFDNCTTRARDMIIDHLPAHTTDFPRLKDVDALSTYRTEIHRWNEHHRWARFGNDLLLGYMADSNINKQEWEFLPKNLSDDFGTEARKDTSSEERPTIDVYPQKERSIKLVDSTFYVVAPQAESIPSEPITPFMASLAIGLLILALSVWEVYKKENLWWLDPVLMILTGLPGLILLAMVFSEHPTVQVNFQMLILNPLNLVFVWKLMRRLRQGRMYWYYNLWGTLIIISLLMQIWQHYAEGMNILASSLLLRYLLRSVLYELNFYKPGNKQCKKEK